MANTDFDNILTTTLDKHRTDLVDGIFKARPLTYFLMQSGQFRSIDGGDKIIEPLVFAENGTAESYAGAEALNTADTEVLTASSWDWGQLSVSVRITGLDEAKNSGAEALIHLLDTKVKVAKESAIQKLNEMFVADGTGNSGVDWNGLANLIDTANASGTALGGIAPSAGTYWQTAYNDATAESIALPKLRTAFNSAAKGNDTPGFVLTTQTLYEAYEALLQPSMRYPNATAADGGFQSLEFKGRPVVYDEEIPAGKVYMINPKYLKLVGHSNNWFKMTPFIRPNNMDVRIAQVLSYGQLVLSSRRHHSVLTAKTA
jgi:hypothetical protein